MISQEFLHQANYYIGLNLPRVVSCVNMLSEEEVWHKPNANSNSIGNLILHLCGNMTQYILSGLGGKPDERQREAEFSASGGLNKEELLARITEVVIQVQQVISQIDEATLLKKRIVQGFEMTGVGIIIHVVEHFSYHTGQIAFWTKLLTNEDLGFYKGMNLNAKNEV
ncbi:DinB family protein [Thermoflexibacter ruber]|uniref:Uncharacterized damage-inducible protein DinB (Forms a four-helix bundle) n=1 Tax=Thermoflexibacter ruber TaxID=1003 RepID=A0A1I2JUT4_9BACT|nr:DinB family protein [Thermoflexibacter ruber]SFF57650.1 Uncharacterized damage-inducible protein DinB (forms a four-helix bundle) [Thermoflexibacter ruber]